MKDLPFFGGVELGGSKTVCAVGSTSMGILEQVRLATEDPSATLEAAIQYFRERSKSQRVESLGIASFGPLDLNPDSSTFGHIGLTPKGGWSWTELLDLFRRELGIPVYLQTDVAAAALAESRFGAANDVDQFVYLTLGTGIGGAAIVRGRLLKGPFHPEMGHIPVYRMEGDTFEGSCPFHGSCLEGMASGSSIAARVGRDAHEVPLDHEVWKYHAGYLAQGLASYTYVLAPGCIVLGGGIALGRDGLLPRLRDELREALAGFQEPGNLEYDYLRSAVLGGDAGIRGALLLAELGAEAGAVSRPLKS